GKIRPGEIRPDEVRPFEVCPGFDRVAVDFHDCTLRSDQQDSQKGLQAGDGPVSASIAAWVGLYSQPWA
ncbi:MAG: hypothetical protein QGI09_12490, partial [Dehalococcoidia bacterium]|nr:hypothetical protein [Dehalococcoidia bacterium]